MNLEELKKRFKILGSHIQDKITGKTHYCPHDLGFNFTLNDCAISCCRYYE